MTPEQLEKAKQYVNLLQELLERPELNHCEEQIIQEAIRNLGKYWQCMRK